MKKIISNFRMLLLVAGLLSVTALGCYLWGRSDGIDSVESKVNQQAVKDVETRTQTKILIQRMPKNEVQKLLEEKWCRDC